MRRQMISKIGYDNPLIKKDILQRGKDMLKVTLAQIRATNPGVSPDSIQTVLSFAKLDYQNPNLPDGGFLMDITFEKRSGGNI